MTEIEPHFEKLKKKPPTQKINSFVSARDVSFHFRELEQVHVCLGTTGLSQVDNGRHTLNILNTILGGSMSSRLFQEIRENRGLAYSIYSFSASFYDLGLFGVYMGVTKETVRDAVTIVLQELKKIRDQKVEEKELQNVKEQLKGNMLLALESTDSRMSRIAKCEIYHNEFIPIEEVIQSIDAVTPEDIRELAHQIFLDEHFTFTFLGPVTEDNISQELLTLQ